MEYDHLNYTPPANNWKPHYQRMNNGVVLPGEQAAPVPLPRNVSPTPPIPPLPKLKPPIADDEQPILTNGDEVPPTPPKREDISSPVNQDTSTE